MSVVNAPANAIKKLELPESISMPGIPSVIKHNAPFYAGLGVVAALGVVEAPIAAIIGIGHAFSHKKLEEMQSEEEKVWEVKQ